MLERTFRYAYMLKIYNSFPFVWNIKYTIAIVKKPIALQKYINGISGINAKEIWMGANDLDNENDWVWSDKSKFSFTNWRDKSEPNNRDNNEHCGTMRAIDGWNDQRCSKLFFYMCEK